MIEPNIFLQGDAFELIKQIPDGSVDMVLTDPPYGTTENYCDKPVDLKALWTELYRVAKPNAAFVITSQMPFTVDLINSNRRHFRYEWIWHKSLPTGFLNANRMPLKAHENICVFYRRLPLYNPQKTQGKPIPSVLYGGLSSNYKIKKKVSYSNPTGERYPVDIQTFKSDPERFDSSRKHKGLNPTAKPRALFEYLIRTYTNPGEVVLDPFAGSGTTARAATNSGRRYICFELNEKHIKL